MKIQVRGLKTAAAAAAPAARKKKDNRGFAMLVLFSAGAGWYLLRKRNMDGATQVDPEKSPLTRHMVPLADRIDQDRLRELLAQEETNKTSGVSGQSASGGASGLR